MARRAFGDLHLEHIRNWREDRLGSMGYEMLYPLWKVDYSVLARRLKESQVPCIVLCFGTARHRSWRSHGPSLTDRLPSTGYPSVR
jgi:hypothetical protein